MANVRRRIHDQALINEALNALEAPGSSYRKVSEKYGIPKSTLEFKKKNPGHKATFGPSPVLSKNEEDTLVKWIFELAKKGFPRKTEDILASVQKFLTAQPRESCFKNNRPGDGWFKAFLKRHPRVTQRTSEAVTTASSCVSEANVRKWFAEVEAYLIEKNLLDVIADPSRVYNGDESGFQICPSTGKVFAQKGAKNVYSIDRGSSKENLTVMFTFSANGAICCPMVIYPYKRIPDRISACLNPFRGIGRSDSGWMTSETFYQYISNVFYPHLVENEIHFPVILFVDGHKSHLTYELSVLCNKLQIEVIALYPNATRIIQPADVAVFRPLKVAWRQAVGEWQMNNPGESLNKVTFGPVLQSVVDRSTKPETLIAGFKACGLCPFNPDAIDYNKCLGSDVHPNKDQPKDYVDHSVSLNYEQFQKIVGHETIEKFNKMTEISPAHDNEDFFSLHKIRKHFKNFGKVKILQNIVLQAADTDKPSESTSHLVTEASIEPVPVMCSVQSNVSLEIPTETSNNLESKHEELSRGVSLLHNGKDSAPSTSRADDEVLMLAEKSTEVNDSSAQLPNFSLGTANSRINSSEISVVKSDLLGDYLTWPESPRKQGKRNTERFPFAITSRRYQEMFERKRQLQLETEELKEERKKKRQEIKQTKENMKKKVNSKKVTQLEKERCKICNFVVGTSKHLLRCDECKLPFHKKCVPTAHKKHVPDEDDDLYVCHICYKEESEDDCQDNSEDGTEEDGSMRNECHEDGMDEDAESLEYEHMRDDKEENDETKMLFEFYKQEIKEHGY